MTPPRKYFLVRGNHATAISAGPMLDPGEETNLVDPDDPHDAALIEEGVLLELAPKGRSKAKNDDTKESS